MTVSSPVAAPAATIGRRVGAFAIDLAIAYALGAALIGIMTGVVFGAGADPVGLAILVSAGSLVIGLVLFAWWLVYSAMQGGRGSIGQRLLGLQLHDADAAGPIGFWRAVWRNIVFGLAGSIVIGYFSPLLDGSRRHQGWHDKASRAVVVNVRGTDAASRLAVSPAAAVDNPYLPWPDFTARASAPAAASAPSAPSLASAAAAPTSTSAPAAPPAPPAAVPVAAGAPVPWPGYGAAPAPSAPVRPSPPVVTRVIDGMPWVTGEAPSAPVVRAPQYRPPATEAFPSVTMPFPAATTTEPFGAAVAAAAASVATIAPADELDSTRVAVPPPAQRAALYAEAPVLAVLTWDDGTRMAVYGRTLYGRNPAAETGAVSVAVRDETLSLSKTHFEIGGDAGGAWIADRHSTNGTVLVRDGVRIPLAPAGRTTLRVGDQLEFGDRRVAVGAA